MDLFVEYLFCVQCFLKYTQSPKMMDTQMAWNLKSKWDFEEKDGKKKKRI